MAKRSAKPLTDEETDAPTRKLSIPAELARTPVAPAVDPVEAAPAKAGQTSPTPAVTKKMSQAEIDSLRAARTQSGTRPAVTAAQDEARARFERREVKETIPAPADTVEIPVAELRALIAGTKR